MRRVQNLGAVLGPCRFAMIFPLLALSILSGCGPSQSYEELPGGGGRRPSYRTYLTRTEAGEQILSTDFCAPDEQGRFPAGARVLNHGRRLVRTRSRDLNPYFSSGGGCIRRPIQEVWAASLNWGPMQLNDTGRAIVRRIPQDRVPLRFKYEVSHRVDPFPFISVNWILEWAHALASGTLQRPREVVIQFKKISGTHYIDWWKGWINLYELSPQVTSFGLDVELLAHGKDVVAAQNLVYELYEKLSRVAPDWQDLR